MMRPPATNATPDSVATDSESMASPYLREELERFMASVPKRKRRSLRARISRMRDFLWWREEFRDLSTRFYYFVRNYALRL